MGGGMTQEDLDLRYIEESFRGCGAFGKVFIYGIKKEYENTGFLHRVAVKSSPDSMNAGREIRILNKLKNEKYIVTMISYTTIPCLIFMECCNADLATFIKRRKFAITLKDLYKMCKDMVSGLIVLISQGILHRDVKPANYLVEFRGGDGSNILELLIKLCDFGFGRPVNWEMMERDELDNLTKDLGTPGYMSPEITLLEDEDDYNGKYTSMSDFWSFGVSSLYLASEGKTPFRKQYFQELSRDFNTDHKRDIIIKSKVEEVVVDSLSSISSIITDILKWNPKKRITANKCLTLLEHLEKHEDLALIKKSKLANIQSNTAVISRITIPNEAKVKKILGYEKYDAILESCADNSIKIENVLQLAKNLDTSGILQKDMSKEIELNPKHSITNHFRRLLSLWYKTSGSDMSLQRLIEGLKDPLVSWKGLAMELSQTKSLASIEIPSPVHDKKDATEPIVVLIGRTGDGKSTFANFLLSTDAFEVGNGCDSVTEHVMEHHGFLNNDKNRPLCIIDTPGLDDSGGRDQENLDLIVDYLHNLQYVSALVLVLKKTSGRFTASIKDMFRTFEMSFGREFWKHLIIKVKSAKMSEQFIKKLKDDFQHARDIQIESSIFEFNCKEELITKNDYSQSLSSFYKLVNSKGYFDCSSIDAIKTQQTLLKNKIGLLHLENNKLANEIYQLTGVKKVLDILESENDANITRNNDKQLANRNEAKYSKEGKLLYVPEDVTIKYQIPSSETSQLLKPLELVKDNYMLTFKNNEGKEDLEEQCLREDEDNSLLGGLTNSSTHNSTPQTPTIPPLQSNNTVLKDKLYCKDTLLDLNDTLTDLEGTQINTEYTQEHLENTQVYLKQRSINLADSLTYVETEQHNVGGKLKKEMEFTQKKGVNNDKNKKNVNLQMRNEKDEEWLHLPKQSAAILPPEEVKAGDISMSDFREDTYLEGCNVDDSNNYFDQGMEQSMDSQIQHKLTTLKVKVKDTGIELERYKQEQEDVAVDFSNFKEVEAKLGILGTQNFDSKTDGNILKQQKDKMESNIREKNMNLASQKTTIVNIMISNFIEVKEVQTQVLDKKVTAWQRQQQLAGNGFHMTLSLETLQEWCECLSEIIWSMRQQIKQLENLHFQQNNCTDTPSQISDLLKGITDLLSNLVTRSFIVEKQPSQVMMTNERFTSTVRLLVGDQLNIHMASPKVMVSIISEIQANVLLTLNPQSPIRWEDYSSGLILNGHGNMEFHAAVRQMSVTFRNLQLKKIKRKEKKGMENIVEEKFSLLFWTEFQVGELKFCAWTLSLPVVIIDRNQHNQEPLALATIIWDNAFSERGRQQFTVPESMSWARICEALNMKWLSTCGTTRNLTKENMYYLACKAFKDNSLNTDDFKNLQLSWSKFCKEPLPDRTFTFFEWFYWAMKLTANHMRGPWDDGYIMGIVSKHVAEDLLMSREHGSFLLRFSDSVLGGVSIAYIQEEHNQKDIFMLAPFTNKDLLQRSISDIIFDLKQHLTHLYPNTPMEVFRKFTNSDNNDQLATSSSHKYVPVGYILQPKNMSTHTQN